MENENLKPNPSAKKDFVKVEEKKKSNLINISDFCMHRGMDKYFTDVFNKIISPTIKKTTLEWEHYLLENKLITEKRLEKNSF